MEPCTANDVSKCSLSDGLISLNIRGAVQVMCMLIMRNSFYVLGLYCGLNAKSVSCCSALVLSISIHPSIHPSIIFIMMWQTHIEQVVSIIRIETICGPPQLLVTVLQCLRTRQCRAPHWPRSFLQQFPSYSNRKCKKSQFSRTAAHIFVSPGDAPAIITQCVAWMERQFNACQTPRSM